MDQSTVDHSTVPSFLNTNLQQSILTAGQQAKTLLCLVTDDSDTSSRWEAIISEQKYRPHLTAQFVTLKIHTGTQEAEYLNTVCPLNGVPALIAIKRGAIEENLQHQNLDTAEFQKKCDELFGSVTTDRDRVLNTETASDAPIPAVEDSASKPDVYIVLSPSTGRMRLPNNAYDALREQTQEWLDQGISGDNVLKLQLKLLRNIPAMSGAVTLIEKRDSSTAPELSTGHEDRLLKTPSAALGIKSTPTPSGTARNGSQETQPRRNDTVGPAVNSATRPAPQHQQQRTDYVRAQREREASERAERERIKAQIASDRAERRRLDDLRRQSERKAELDALRRANSTTTNPNSSDIRIQVRTFDGSTIKTTFARESSISAQVRPWIDQQSEQTSPYNLKLILTPLPNRNIEASEEEHSLSDLGIVGSATMVMVPVKGYVESYTGSGSGLVSAVTGAVGGVLGGIGSLIGWSGGSESTSSSARETTSTEPEARNATEPHVRVRTLADQRAEEANKQGNELYNGNQLNFQGRKDDDADKKQD